MPLHAKVVILLAVLVSMATTYLTVRQSMKRGMMPAATPDNPMGKSQKYMAYIMPFFALTGLYWPFGLVLYWVTTNLWTLGQQWVLFKRYPCTPPSAGGRRRGPGPGPQGHLQLARAAGQGRPEWQRGERVRRRARRSRPRTARPARTAAKAATAANGKPAQRRRNGRAQGRERQDAAGSRVGDAQANGAGDGRDAPQARPRPSRARA